MHPSNVSTEKHGNRYKLVTVSAKLKHLQNGVTWKGVAVKVYLYWLAHTLDLTQSCSSKQLPRYRCVGDCPTWVWLCTCGPTSLARTLAVPHGSIFPNLLHTTVTAHCKPLRSSLIDTMHVIVMLWILIRSSIALRAPRKNCRYCTTSSACVRS